MPHFASYAEGNGPMLRSARTLPPWLVPAYTRREATSRGATAATILVQDYDQRLLIPLTEESSSESATGAMPIDGTAAGRAYSTMAPVELADGDGVRLLLPLIDGGDRLGVLEVLLPAAAPVEEWEEFSSAVAALIVSKGGHTDVFIQARRRQDMALAAEMQWQLLPPLSVFDPRLTLSGVVEPAYAVGGDAFDYAINQMTAHVAVLDAMGHGLDAAVMSTVALSSYRHGRRLDAPVTDLYTLVDSEFTRQFSSDQHGGDKFVTAQFATLDLPTGRLNLVNAGHPSPLHIRGSRVIGEISGPTTLPVGLGGEPPQIIATDLEPGDRLVLYTDGVVDARRDGETYGEAHFVDDVQHVLGDELPLPEVVRRLNQRLSDWRGGVPDDDATIVLLEWRGPDLPLP
jgi:serine phosphatase RsbU (regulator of sigma subunit)